MSDYSFMKTGFDPVGDNINEEDILGEILLGL